ncbi:Transcriptional regulator, LacI family [Bifidobacterium actinocoloniiforme DSM 22766]|uniref:Transcriptional regulator, LacI family n=2 Tax=Bifidobacterium actinocoloniiforme TaxID=638619 RepID=A0A086YZL5_9BIFI|nr:LacI family transcriptional regulator [Bifidobacterium actinocoloniiforme DSM 22766]KFI39715.1 Transcriptional regulator, LacI family [Bifidobacterium actinocoloniiforme DSM 22766]
MGFVTIRDVARQAKVSTAAVSQVLNGKGRFSAETKKAVRRAAQDLGYIPDSRAQAMRSDSTQMVGLLVPDLRNPYFADLVSSMETMLYEHGFGALIGTSAESVKRQDDFIMRILGQRIDGVIAVPQGADSSGIEALVSRELPLVFVDRRVPGMDTVPYVVSDPYSGLREALELLRRYGHRRVAYVAHPSLGSFSVNERAQAFRSLAPTYCGPDDSAVFSCDDSAASRQSTIDRILAFKASAVIFGYSPDAIGSISLLRGLGIEIGSRISLVSFDDIDAFRLLSPQISVISQQVQLMGRRGVEILMDRIAAGRSTSSQRSQLVSIPTVFKRRDSVGRLS